MNNVGACRNGNAPSFSIVTTPGRYILSPIRKRVPHTDAEQVKKCVILMPLTLTG